MSRCKQAEARLTVQSAVQPAAELQSQLQSQLRSHRSRREVLGQQRDFYCLLRAPSAAESAHDTH
jgi:hypothetical protein